MSDYDRMRQRHYDGMCGGDCPECYRQQREEHERDRYEEYLREKAEREAAEKVAEEEKA